MATIGSGIVFEKYGFEELAGKLRLLQSKASNPGSTVMEGAKIIADEARRLVPVDTGALKASIKERLDSGGSTYAEASILVGEYYGVFVEFGTSKMAAQPFLRPAFANKSDAAALAMGKDLETLITEVAK